MEGNLFMKISKLNFFTTILNVLLSIFLMGCFSFFTYYLIKLNILPTKYLVLIFLLFLFLLVFLFSFLFSKKKKITKGVAMFLTILFSSLFLLGSKYLTNTYHFFENSKVEYDTLTYSVVVLKENNYHQLEE